MNQKAKENILGYHLDSIGVQGYVSEISDSISNSEQVARCRWLACMNPHSYAESLRDNVFSAALNDAEWLIPDGSGIVLASRMLNGSICERVTGSDIFQGVSRAMNDKGTGRVFFLGSTEETLATIKTCMAVDYPKLEIVGTYSPPFKPEYTDKELNDMVDAINAVSPDVLWVGMTAPKQEKWLFKQAPRLDVKFAAAVGAVFDFYTGNVKRSPPIFQRMHLEWLPRLVQQPRRLWRRMVVSAPIFMWHVIRQRFGFNEKLNP